MMKLSKLISVFAFSFTSLILADQPEGEKVSHPELKPYPQKLEELERRVIVLPKLEDETLYKVELIPGKTVRVDGINSYFIGLSLKAEVLKGWGYSYYTVEGNGAVGSTRMGGRPNLRDEFVKGKSMIIRYNSKLPVVIYVPKGTEIKYRIWKAGKELSDAKKG